VTEDFYFMLQKLDASYGPDESGYVQGSESEDDDEKNDGETSETNKDAGTSTTGLSAAQED
jgi:hypothetical protein